MRKLLVSLASFVGLVPLQSDLFAAEPAVSSITDPSNRGELAEVLVTAEKRVERLQDVPVPVAVLSSEDLIESHQLRVQDYFSSVPGVSVSGTGLGGTVVVIRGLNTGGNPTVGVTIDDVPYGTPNSYGGGTASGVPDIDPAILSNVEILRGPQGTLYGASSLAGLVKYTTIDPSTDAINGRVQADLNHFTNGAGAGYGVRGAVNVPITDSFAVRLSGFTRRDAGYIDDVLTGEHGVNRTDVYGGHLAALWRMSDEWSLRLSGLVEETKEHGPQQIQPEIGSLAQAWIPNTGRAHHEVAFAGATLKGKIGAAEFSSITGFNSFLLQEGSRDASVLLGGVSSTILGSEFGGTNVTDHYRTNKITQEVRISIPLSEQFDWLLGAFYTDTRSKAHEGWFGENPATGQLVFDPLLLDAYWPSTFREYAGFTDLTWHVIDRFDIQFGARESKNRQTYSEIDGGLYGPFFFGTDGPLVTPEIVTNDKSFTYLVTPRYKLSDDAMIYARLASGYRPGGPNAACVAFNIPCSFKPDRTQNYEIGFKGAALSRHLTYDLSVYYIKWNDIQLTILGPSGIYQGNASKAKSQGVEFSVQSHPIESLTAGAWVSFNDAKVTEDFPAGPAYAVSGDRLPMSARWTGNVSLEQDFAAGQSGNFFVAAAMSYVGNRLGNFAGAPGLTRGDLPSYTRVDLRAGYRHAPWDVTVYGTNLGNKLGQLTEADGISPGRNYTQPRLLGLSFTTSF